MVKNSDFEAFLYELTNTYATMAADPDNMPLRVVGHSAPVVIAFERYMDTLGRLEPTAETGHVLDATVSLFSTMLASFCSVVSNDRQDEKLYNAMVEQVLANVHQNLTDPDAGIVTTVKLTGRSN